MSKRDLQRSRNCVCVCVCSATVRLKSVQSEKWKPPDRLKEKKPRVIDSLCCVLPCLINYPHTSRVKCHTFTCCGFGRPVCSGPAENWTGWWRGDVASLRESHHRGHKTMTAEVLLCAFTHTKISGGTWA